MTDTQDRSRVASYDRRCFLPVPDESLEEYLSQAQTHTFLSDHVIPQRIVQVFRDLFFVDITVIPVEVSSKGLWPWELACCFIDAQENPLVRYRSKTKIAQHVLIAHEMIHATRARLISPKFEEYCAYAASAALFPNQFSRWRAWLGPLCSSGEVVSLVAGIWLFWIVGMIFLWPGFFLWFWIFLCSSCVGLLLRLWYRWRVWRSAFNCIASVWPKSVWALVIRLHDKDIVWVSKISSNDIEKRVEERAVTDWRWQFFKEKILKN